MLEHEADIALADAAGEGVIAVEQDLPLVRPFQAGDDPQQRGLARAGRPEQRNEFAGLDLQVDVGERRERIETLGDVLNVIFIVAFLLIRLWRVALEDQPWRSA